MSVLISLFFSCFLAATILPFSSEAFVALALLNGEHATWVIVVIATLGNTLGGMTGYYLGYLGKTEWLKKWFRIEASSYERFTALAQKYGFWLALLGWLPIVGDPITVLLGFLKTKSLPTFSCLLVGKLLRYLVVAYATLCFTT